MRAQGLLLLLGVVSACADLEGLPPTGCGNGVIDPGEECDTPNASDGRCGPAEAVTACRYLCDRDEDCFVEAGQRCFGGACRRFDSPVSFRAGPVHGGLSVDPFDPVGLDVAVADFDDDGRDDLLLRDRSSAEDHSVLFSGADAFESVPPPAGALTVGKFDGDDVPDLARLSLRERLEVSVFRGGTRTFPAAARLQPAPGDATSRWVGVRRRPENRPAQSAQRLLAFSNEGVHALEDSGFATVGVFGQLEGTVVGAAWFDRARSCQQLLEVQPPAAGGAGATFRLYEPCLPTRRTPWRLTLLRSIDAPTDVDAARPLIIDFDGDGALDLVARVLDGDEVAVWRGNGAGAFGAVTRHAAGPVLETRASFEGVYAVDMDGDGIDDDLWAGCFAEGPLSGAKDCSVYPPQDLALESVTFGDFNGDGRLDVAGSHRSPETEVTVMLTGEEGRMSVVARSLPDAPGAKLRVGDFDGDGVDDLLILEVGQQSPATSNPPAGGPPVEQQADGGVLAAATADAGAGRMPPRPSPMRADDAIALSILYGGDGLRTPRLSFEPLAHAVDIAVVDVGASDAAADFIVVTRQPDGTLQYAAFVGNFERVARPFSTLGEIDTFADLVALETGRFSPDDAGDQVAVWTCPSTASGDVSPAEGPSVDDSPCGLRGRVVALFGAGDPTLESPPLELAAAPSIADAVPIVMDREHGTWLLFPAEDEEGRSSLRVVRYLRREDCVSSPCWDVGDDVLLRVGVALRHSVPRAIDVTGDGIADLVFAGFEGAGLDSFSPPSYVGLLLRDEDGTFPGDAVALFSDGKPARSFAALQRDCDAAFELVVVGDAGVCVYDHQPSRDVRGECVAVGTEPTYDCDVPGLRLPIEPSLGAEIAASGDVNGDGMLDLILSGPGRVRTFLAVEGAP